MDRSHLLLTTRRETSVQRGGLSLFSWFLVVTAVTTFLGSTAEAQPLPDDTRGYVSRACGFDMNDNGIVGEPADCDVCDGVTTDPDGDGDPEDLIYVDCNSGSDSGGNGSPGNPYRTIAKAFSVADGPGDGREDIVCARATCSAANGSAVSNQDIPVSGIANKGPGARWFYTRARKGPEERDFQYPSDPVMVVGWDTDNDGEYPPYDTDQPEPLVLDACSSASCSGGTIAAIGFRLRSDRDYIELAHFTMKNYGRSGATPSASISLDGSGIKTGVFVHDLVIDKPNYLRDDVSTRAAVYFMGNGLTWFALENVRIADFGGWALRGGLKGDYVRFRNIDQFGPKTGGGAESPGTRIWDFNHGEVLNLELDADMENGAGQVGKTQGFQLSIGARNTVFRNNLFRNCDDCININMRSCVNGICSQGDNIPSIENLVFDRQIFTRDIDSGQWGHFFMVHSRDPDGSERGGSSDNADPNCVQPQGLGDVTIKNSVFQTTVKGVNEALVLKIGSNCANANLDGVVTVDNNTFSMTNTKGPLVRIGNGSGQNWDFKYYLQSYRFRNNAFARLSSTKVFELQHMGGDGYYGDTKYPSDFIATGNAYGGTLSFIRDTATYASLSAWQSATKYDVSSDACATSFAADGFHLAADDACSKDTGLNAVCASSDVDGRGRARSASDPCDRGADEEGNGGAPPPDPEPVTLPAPVLREARPVPAQ